MNDKYATIYIQALNDYMQTKPLKFFQDKYSQKLYDLGRFLGSVQDKHSQKLYDLGRFLGSAKR